MSVIYNSFWFSPKTLYLIMTYYNCTSMSEVVHHRDSHNKSQSGLSRYNYMCDECGLAFQSLDKWVEHYRIYHPGSIGTAIT